jgi:hypothetical protein
MARTAGILDGGGGAASWVAGAKAGALGWGAARPFLDEGKTRRGEERRGRERRQNGCTGGRRARGNKRNAREEGMASGEGSVKKASDRDGMPSVRASRGR